MAGDLDVVVGRFREAHATHRPMKLLSCEAELSIDEAYDVQDLQVDLSCARDGATIAGYKISLTSAEAQASVGTDEPTYGTLLDAQVLGSPAEVSLAALFRPLLEAELVFLFEDNLPVGAGPEEIVARSRVAAGLEIPDSRYEDWYPDPALTLVDLIADNSVAGRLVLAQKSVPASSLDLSEVGMELRHDAEVVVSASSSAVLGNPLRAVTWLANRLAGRGRAIRRGTIVSSGTFSAPLIVAPGSYEAAFEGIGSVHVTFTE